MRGAADRPDRLDARLELARLELRRGKPRLAVREYQAAIELDSESSKAYAGLGAAHAALGQYESAVAAYRNAVQLDSQVAVWHLELGKALAHIALDDDAVAHLRRARELAPELGARAAGAEASVYERQGRLEAAIRVLDPWIGANPLDAHVGVTYANICRRRGDYNEGIAALRRALDAGSIDKNRRRRLLFALGKLYEAAGDHDRSFEHYQAANQMTTVKYNNAETRDIVNRRITLFSSSGLASLSHAQRSTRTVPIFIVGMPRSGTSLLEQILASHPEVVPGGELPYLHNIANNVCGHADQVAAERALNSLGSDTLEATAHTYVKHALGDRTASRYVTDKMPTNFFHLGLIELLFPGACIVHCQRDAKDTCFSIFAQNFNLSHSYANRLSDIGSFYNEYRRMMDHWKETLNLPIHDVCYEDLVHDPETTVHELLKFCGLTWDDRCMRFHDNDYVTRTASYAQVREPLNTGSVGRARRFERHLDELARALDGGG